MPVFEDDQVAKALAQLRTQRRRKPHYLQVGILLLVGFCFSGYMFDHRLLEPLPAEQVVQRIQMAMIFAVTQSLTLVLAILCIIRGRKNNPRDILLEALAERILDNHAAPPDKTADTANDSHARRPAARKHE